MRGLRATFVLMVLMLVIVPWGSAEIRTLGIVENGSGTLDLNNASWDLSGTFNEVGPVFKDPNVLESEGDYFHSVWEIRQREFGTTLVEGNVTELPLASPVSEGNNNYRIDNGIIYLNSNRYKDLTFTFSGQGQLQLPEEDQKYKVDHITGELTYDAADDNTPDESDDEESGGSAGCFISGVSSFIE